MVGPLNNLPRRGMWIVLLFITVVTVLIVLLDHILVGDFFRGFQKFFIFIFHLTIIKHFNIAILHFAWFIFLKFLFFWGLWLNRLNYFWFNRQLTLIFFQSLQLILYELLNFSTFVVILIWALNIIFDDLMVNDILLRSVINHRLSSKMIAI